MAEEGEEQPQLTWSGGYDEDGKPHGQGVLSYPAPPKKEEEEEEKPGDKFEGTLEHGQRQGKGKYTWTNGCCYDGAYQNHVRHGQGTLTLPDKSQYKGEWSENKMHGQGTYVYASGDIYTGSFVEGTKQGSGSYYFKSTESQYIGEWDNGSFVSGTWALSDGSQFKGDFGPQAKGQCTFAANSGLCQEGCNEKGRWTAVGTLGVSAN